LALQIENEVFETMKGVSVGLSDDMRALSKAARDLGMNVPFFTNDAWVFKFSHFIRKKDRLLRKMKTIEFGERKLLVLIWFASSLILVRV
jgi:hypothetical protein